jgi:hypothetical protein
MPGRTIAAALTVSLIAAGCTTTTAHRLVLIDNPLRQQAVACEAKCRAESADGSAGTDRYAACLDNCPGARAVDGASCPQPDPGAFCVETTKANAGGIVGGTLAVVGIALAVVSIALLFLFVTVIGNL